MAESMDILKALLTSPADRAVLKKIDSDCTIAEKEAGAKAAKAFKKDYSTPWPPGTPDNVKAMQLRMWEAVIIDDD